MKWLRKKKVDQLNPSFDEQRQQALTEIGAKLKSTREGYSFGIEDVVSYTKIARKLVEAIEEADLGNLPEPIYIRGLIRRYADALGLDGAETANQLPMEVNPVSLKPNWKSNSQQLRPTHLYLLYIGIIVCSVSSLSHVLNTSTIATNSESGKEAGKQASNSNQQFALESASNKQGNNLNNQQVQVGVVVKDSSWIRVEVDGKTEFEGRLPQGSHRTWKAESQLTVKTDNAGGVMVSVNQEQPKPMGEIGKAEQVTVATNTRS
ncbi:helix-turn-helix domain-containing protein [Brunnivagina elsteri]|uniref:Helix-turn-helix domain-containing protein n=1 Tax=Brunnivagina elsteri CCALA 953 TaxID=987040 RepID=A0A2A2TJU9_9CYAN|nr:RodZ domain-containing protein [Calothrix elsteri]PAX56149.1 helix-turn-helix domain-containing protein [Calothrix elsteri CCALA 953]